MEIVGEEDDEQYYRSTEKDISAVSSGLLGDPIGALVVHIVVILH